MPGWPHREVLSILTCLQHLDDSDASKRPRRWAALLTIFVLAAAIRIVYVLALRDHPRFGAPVMDAGYHLAWAKALAQGEEFRAGPLFRAPLYPMALAAMLKVTAGSLLGVRILQALLGALTAALTYRLGARVAGEGPGRVAGILVAVSWALVAFDAELLIPVLLLPLLLLALDLAVAWWGRLGVKPGEGAASSLAPGWRAPLLVGLAFGLAAIARPNVLLFMPVLFGAVLLRERQLMPGVWLTLGTLLPILPVTVHNTMEGDFSLVATQGGVNFWIGNNPASDGAAAIVPGTRDGWWEGYYDAIAQAEAAEGRTLKASEVSDHYRSRALDWMTSYPGDAAQHLLWKARLLAANVEIANNQDMQFLAFRTVPLLRWSPVRWGSLLGFGLVGLFVLIRKRRPGAGLLAAFAGVYALSIVLFFVNARFRLPLVPILAIGSGGCAFAMVDAWRARRWGGLAGLAVPAFVLMALSWITPAGYVSSDANGLAELGRAELARNQPEAALEYLEKAIRANPNSVQVRMALATAIVAAGDDPKRALVLLREARDLPRGADLVELEVQILDTRLSARDLDGTLDAAKAALAKQPKNGALRFVTARAEAMSGQGRGAVARLEGLLEDEPTNVTAALVIAQILEQLGPRSQALAAYERVLRMTEFASPAMLEEAQRKAAALRAGH